VIVSFALALTLENVKVPAVLTQEVVTGFMPFTRSVRFVVEPSHWPGSLPVSASG